MAKKKMTKASKRRLTILSPIVLLAIGYLIVTLITSAYQLYTLHTEEAKLKDNLNELKGASEELKNEITKLQDKDYVARYAREKYLYTKDGEYVIRVDEEKNKKQSPDFEINDDYIIYGGIALGGIIILYILFRKKDKKSSKKKRS